MTTKLQDLRHIEYGYATTSHSSQGATIDRVLVNIDTEQSVALVNQQQFYVSLSRARHDARIFTNKREDLVPGGQSLLAEGNGLGCGDPMGA